MVGSWFEGRGVGSGPRYRGCHHPYQVFQDGDPVLQLFHLGGQEGDTWVFGGFLVSDECIGGEGWFLKCDGLGRTGGGGWDGG